MSNSNSRRRTPKWLRNLSRSLSHNAFVTGIVAMFIILYLKLVYKTNKWIVEPEDALEKVNEDLPVIATIWHGQQVLIAAIPMGLKANVMISRSIDGEITSRVAKAFGNKAIRASGGRDQKQIITKGALTGFLEMVSALENGENVLQTADISKGTPRRAGPGIIMLAKKSGRPIVPLAVASSRRWVLPKSYDQTTINGPFGTSSIVMGDLVWVDKDADATQLEEARVELQSELDRITKKAYALTGKPEQ